MARVLCFMSVVLTIPFMAQANRDIPECPETLSLKVSFNQEQISAYCLVIDARTEAEKQEDSANGRLKGPLIVFFQGHAQRPSDAFPLTSKLALGSRSGIVVVPVCDTPYGTDEQWRGDSGKEVILLEIVRWSLPAMGISLAGYELPEGLEVKINGEAVEDCACPVRSDLILVGWSHGGILARRIAHRYPEVVRALGQVCPAGYEDLGPFGLMGRFTVEALRLSKLTVSGHGMDTFKSAWGFTRGLAGDFARSIPDAFMNLHPAKMLRIGKDVKDCSLLCNSARFSARHLKKIAVVFGSDDTCMSPGRILSVEEEGSVDRKTLESFRATYFGDVEPEGTALFVDILPGTHLGPVTHSDDYVRTLLVHLDGPDDSQGRPES